MKFTRRSVHEALDEAARAQPAAVDPVFANQLEKRLKSLDLSIPTVSFGRTLRRSVPRGLAIGVVAAGITGVAAAAMAVVITHNKADNHLIVASSPQTSESPTPSSLEPTTTAALDSTSTSVATSTTVNRSTTTIAVEATALAPAPTMAVPPAVTAATTTTVAATLPPAVAATTTPPPTAPPTVATLPRTEPPATSSPTTTPPTDAPTTSQPPEPTTTSSTAPATTTTEVHTPATITLSCALVPGGVQCSWSGAPPETDHYIVLKSSPGTSGRVLTPAPGATTITDNDVSSGRAFTYLVHAESAANQSIAHSEPSTVTCCL